MPNGLEPVFISVRSTVIRKETLGTFEVMAVTLQSGFLQAIGDCLAVNNAEGSIRSSLAAPGQIADPGADFVQHGSLLEPAPGGDQSDGGDSMLARFLRCFQDRRRLDKPIPGRVGLIGR